MTPKVAVYQSERTQMQGIMRTSNAIQRQRHRIERLEALLFRALLTLEYHPPEYSETLRADITDALAGKHGRPGRRKEP